MVNFTRNIGNTFIGRIEKFIFKDWVRSSNIQKKDKNTKWLLHQAFQTYLLIISSGHLKKYLLIIWMWINFIYSSSITINNTQKGTWICQKY